MVRLFGLVGLFEIGCFFVLIVVIFLRLFACTYV